MAAKAPMIEEKRNMFLKATYKMKVVDTSFDEKGTGRSLRTLVVFVVRW